MKNTHLQYNFNIHGKFNNIWNTVSYSALSSNQGYFQSLNPEWMEKIQKESRFAKTAGRYTKGGSELNFKPAFPFIISIFLLTGCWGARNIDQLVYIDAIGVDYKDHHFIVYVQLISFTGLAKVETGGAQEKTSVAVGRFTGETFNIATDELYTSIQRMVSWGHVNYPTAKAVGLQLA